MNPNPIKFSDTTSVNIDLLRVYAFQTVCIGHGLGLVLDLQLAIEIGKTSIITFFLLSGLLTTFSLFNKLDREDYDFKKYFVNRFARIYPPLVVSLILIIFIDGYWATFNELDRSIYSYNIVSFIACLLLINESILGLPSFGSANPLWTLPIFWWSYLFLGWIILGKKTTKKKAYYYLFLIFFTFMMLFTFCGPLYKENLINNIKMLYIWVSGVFVFLILNKYYKGRDKYKINDNNPQKGISTHIENKELNLVKRIFSSPIFYGGISAVLYIIALFNQILTLDTYNINHIVLVILSILFLYIFSQYTTFKFNPRVKKIAKFLSSYSFTLYILHFPTYHFLLPFRDTVHPFLLFLLGYVISNLLSILIASFTERKARNIEKYLLKKLNLED